MDVMGMPEPCQPIGCDNGYHIRGCFYHSVDRDVAQYVVSALYPRMLNDLCGFCISYTLSSAMRAELITSPEEVERTLTINTHGMHFELQLKPRIELLVHQIIAGRPMAFIEVARGIGNKPGTRWFFNGSEVGIWAQLEWFGLRICAFHCWEAQALWKAGGNNHWSR